MMGMDQSASLRGAWVHSFEEDEGAVQVYRPSNSFTLPPSRRNRETLEFDTPGQVIVGSPGPDDKLVRTVASLTPLGINRFRLGEARVIEVVEQGSDILKVRPV